MTTTLVITASAKSDERGRDIGIHGSRAYHATARRTDCCGTKSWNNLLRDVERPRLMLKTLTTTRKTTQRGGQTQRRQTRGKPISPARFRLTAGL
jgi:hypothetical protein